MKATAASPSKERENLEPASDLGREAVEAISAELRRLLADVFALYLKTKNFHWHMTGRHFGTTICSSMSTAIRSSP
jgi:starvation-inducible DNA-binding protein